MKPIELQNLNMESPLVRDYRIDSPFYLQKEYALDAYVLLDKFGDIDNSHINEVGSTMIANEYFNTNSNRRLSYNNINYGEYSINIGTTPKEAAIAYREKAFPMLLASNTYQLVKVKAYGLIKQEAVYAPEYTNIAHHFRLLSAQNIDIVKIYDHKASVNMILEDMESQKKGIFWNALATYTPFFVERSFFDKYSNKITSKVVKGIMDSKSNSDDKNINMSKYYLSTGVSWYTRSRSITESDIDIAKTMVDKDISEIPTHIAATMVIKEMRKFTTSEYKAIFKRVIDSEIGFVSCFDTGLGMCHTDMGIFLGDPHITTTVLDDLLKYCYKEFKLYQESKEESKWKEKNLDGMVSDIVMNANEFITSRILVKSYKHANVAEMLKDTVKLNPTYINGLVYKLAQININLIVPILELLEEPYKHKAVQTVSRSVAITELFAATFDKYIDWGAASSFVITQYQWEKHPETVDYRNAFAHTNETYMTGYDISFYRAYYNHAGYNIILSCLGYWNDVLHFRGLKWANNPNIPVSFVNILCDHFSEDNGSEIIIKNPRLFINKKIDLSTYMNAVEPMNYFGRFAPSRATFYDLFSDYVYTASINDMFPYIDQIIALRNDTVPCILGDVNNSTDLPTSAINSLFILRRLRLSAGKILPFSRVRPIKNIKMYYKYIYYITPYEYEELIRIGELKTNEDKERFKALVID